MMNNKLPVFFGTMTGNSQDLAEAAAERLNEEGIEAESVNLADGVTPESLTRHSHVLFVISTWGEGEPPDDATEFVDRLEQDEPLGLESVSYSVCALGDTSYDIFCGCGKIVDERLEKHGATRMHPRRDCDVDYEDDFQEWLDGVVSTLKAVSVM